MKMSIIRKTVIPILFLIRCFYNLGFTEVPAGQVLRSQEILEKEKALRNKLDEEEKIFIKKIEVKGIRPQIIDAYFYFFD